MRRAVLVTAFAATLFAAAPGFAFEVQSGGLPLSPQSAALLANRMAGLGGPAAQQPGTPGKSQLPPWMANNGNTEALGAGAATNGQQQLMNFMLGGRRNAGTETEKGFGAKDPTAQKGFAFRR
ncbi:MAG TPA: hypothetical protein VD978_28750 [Azospirillum sp.]|nr:hypothetical protein [Azospirillum sp.]